MFTRRLKVFLLLFGCLFQTNISHGKNGKTKDLLRDSGSSETKKQNMMTNFNQRRNQEKYASMSTGRKNNTKMGIHRSVVKLSWNEIIHTRSHNWRLMQGIRRRQVSFGVSSPGGGDSNIKKVGVLVVSLKGVNFRFWSRLGC